MNVSSPFCRRSGEPGFGVEVSWGGVRVGGTGERAPWSPVGAGRGGRGWISSEGPPQARVRPSAVNVWAKCGERIPLERMRASRGESRGRRGGRSWFGFTESVPGTHWDLEKTSHVSMPLTLSCRCGMVVDSVTEVKGGTSGEVEGLVK